MAFWENQATLTVLQWVLRAFVIFWWLLVVTKLMGQREMGRLNAFDFVVLITFGSVAAGVLNNPELSMQGAMVSVGTLAALNIVIAYLALKNSRFRRIVQDEPLVVVQNGRLIEKMLYRSRLNLDDLLMEMRQKNIPYLHDVEFAILETSGRISIIPKSQARPVTPRDLQIPTQYEGYPAILIEDGHIIDENLKKNGLDRNWLAEQLKDQGFENPDTVLAAMLDTRGRLYLSKKNEPYLQ